MQSGSITRKITAAAFASAAIAVFTASRARAEEPVKATEPTLMAEPGEVVEVVDAFDEKNNDPFDLNLSVGFHQSWTVGNIKRESAIAPGAAGPGGVVDPYGNANSGFTHNIENIARYRQSQSVLNLRADVGLYHDLALFFRVPVIIADDRSLDDLDGSSTAVNKADGTSRVADPANGKSMFSLPFSSPTRSGIDYVAAGFRWSIFNQHRDHTKPTWTIELEGRFGVGDPLRACSSAGNCPNPNAVAYDATNGWQRTGAAPVSAGISRGTNAVKFGSLTSQRYRYVEPYGGFWFMAEFQKRGTAMGDFSGVEGVITNHPPLQGGLIGGLMVHPWENREFFQRFSLDFRFNATYVSQGRDYTPLFDALGTSNAPSLVAPNPKSYALGADGKTSVGNYGVVDPKTGRNDYSNSVYFTGVTDAEAHGIFGGSLGLLVQANEFLKFNGGVGWQYIQAYDVSSADACNPDFKPEVGAAGRCTGAGSAGGVAVSGAPNPNHRAVIDLPGRRFRVTESFTYTLWLNATLMI
jgi:hypothetical protein